jgi:hypothetical protein
MKLPAHKSTGHKASEKLLQRRLGGSRSEILARSLARTEALARSLDRSLSGQTLAGSLHRGAEILARSLHGGAEILARSLERSAVGSYGSGAHVAHRGRASAAVMTTAEQSAAATAMMAMMAAAAATMMTTEQPAAAAAVMAMMAATVASIHKAAVASGAVAAVTAVTGDRGAIGAHQGYAESSEKRCHTKQNNTVHSAFLRLTHMLERPLKLPSSYARLQRGEFWGGGADATQTIRLPAPCGFPCQTLRVGQNLRTASS